jgi:hypothetical protein
VSRVDTLYNCVRVCVSVLECIRVCVCVSVSELESEYERSRDGECVSELESE